MRRILFALVIALGSGIITLGAPPKALACPAGTYQASSGDCVESPDSSTSNATAICRDGTDSHSESHSGTCSHHGGVSQWCPCGSASAAHFPVAALPTVPSTNGNLFAAIAISPVNMYYGWATNATTLAQADEVAMNQCQIGSGYACEVAAWGPNGCVAIAVGSGLFAGAWGTDAPSVASAAIARLPAGGVIDELHCTGQ